MTVTEPSSAASTVSIDPRLQIFDVTHQFPGLNGAAATTVLEHIDIRVQPGEFTALLGPSGCGKTTLLRILAGLLQPSTGHVEVNGTTITGPSNGIGFVFQNDRLLPWLTVEDNAALGLRAKNVAKKEARATVAELLNIVGLSGYATYLPHQLSGGMRQRVNLARALAVQPDVLLMDEPFAALDAQTRELMQEELVRIWAATGSTVLFITHQIDEAVFLANRVVVMRARPGRIREVLDIELPRPRGLDVKHSPAFHAYVDHIWSLIEAQVRAAMHDADAPAKGS